MWLKLALAFNFSIVSLSSYAGGEEVLRYADGFIRNGCDVEEWTTSVGHVEEVRQDQNSDYFYSINVEMNDPDSDALEYGRLRIGKYDISNFSYANIRVLEALLPEELCGPAPLYNEIQLVCGSEPFGISLTFALSKNTAKVFINELGNSDARVAYTESDDALQVIRVMPVHGRFSYNLIQSQDGEWSAVAGSRRGEELRFGCSEI